ncbi:MAG: FAD-dependent oxidoreductase [Gammaproteobacteria bacterium]|nr:FAD-dependent oxidoreductase [Gammaproteobacteria bacterium]
MKDKVLVVGAGIAGLGAATWARDAGFDVTVIEATDRVGGRAVTATRPGSEDRIDVGTQYFHSNYRLAKQLLRSAGLAASIRPVRGRTRFFDRRAPGGSFTAGHRLPIIRAGGMTDNLRLLASGAWRILRDPVSPFRLRDHVRLDTQTAGTRITDPFEWDFTARCLVLAGCLVEPGPADISYLHMVRLMRIVLTTDYLALDGGIATLHERLAAGLDVRLSTPATQLVWDGRVRGVTLADGTTVEATHTVLATPPGAASVLMPSDWHEERAFLQATRHPPALIVTFFLDGPLEDGVWSYILPSDPTRLVGFCVDAAQKNPANIPSGKAALQAWICHPASTSAAALDNEALSTRVLTELAPFFPGIDARVEHVQVQRHAAAVPQFPPGRNQAALAFLARIDERPGLEVCGDYLTGGYMECALWSAERAVRRLRRLTM